MESLLKGRNFWDEVYTNLNHQNRAIKELLPEDSNMKNNYFSIAGPIYTRSGPYNRSKWSYNYNL